LSLRTTLLTSALALTVAVVSCGGTAKKKVLGYSEAGAAGEAPSGGSGNSGGGAGAPDAAGAAGSAPDLTAGQGGQAPAEAGAGGEAEVPPIVIVPPPPPPLLLFTVSSASQGLPGTAVAAQAHKQSVIYASTSPNPDPVNGTNQAAITAAQLGLADSDTLDAFAILEQPAVHPVYVFSVASTESQGLRPTRLARSSNDNEAPGDVYFSDATQSLANVGEGTGQLGYNALVADEQSLGLAPAGAGVDAPLDELTGVQLVPSGVLPSEIYFAVSADSVGLTDSAVATATDTERGCTVFASRLDGKNTAVASCADLGLADGSTLKGLTLYGTTTPTKVLFTLTSASTGLADTAVADTDNQTDNGADNNVYFSTLNGGNELQTSGASLGLDYADRIDALSVFDRAPALYDYKDTCDLTPSPIAPEGGNLDAFASAHGLGDHLLLLDGTAPLVGEVRNEMVAAYDVKTCAFVSRTTLVGSNDLNGRLWAPVPLSGWSPADPLKNLEYWQLGSTTGQVFLEHRSTTGALLATYPLDVPDTFAPLSLDYDARFNRLFAVLDSNDGFQDAIRIALALPNGAPGTTPLSVLSTPIPQPCAYSPKFSGVDSAGNSVYAQYNGQGPLRVCDLTPTGELLDLPANWALHSLNTDEGTVDYALLSPGTGLYALWSSSTAFSIFHHPLSTGGQLIE
jgi:hypothetical protein